MKTPKKILNDPRRATEEMMEGLVLGYDGRVGKIEGHGAFFLKDIPDGKVALLVGGGSGHEPIFGGFLGLNLADGAAAGEVFTSPSPQTICEAVRAIHRGKGVVFVYGNYSGDNMNFDMAAEFLTAEGIDTRTIRVRDDVALLIYNLGATTMFELLIANRRVRQILAREAITVHRSFVGSWLTSQEMAGFSISLMKLDAELKHYLDLPSASFGFSSQ